MNNKERLEKLEQAVRLIREVEFSYTSGTIERSNLFKFVSTHFSFLGFIGQLITKFKREQGLIL